MQTQKLLPKVKGCLPRAATLTVACCHISYGQAVAVAAWSVQGLRAGSSRKAASQLCLGKCALLLDQFARVMFAGGPLAVVKYPGMAVDMAVAMMTK